ncbi:MAG: SH3 domain-containing protein [Clostridiaceae bacterium]
MKFKKLFGTLVLMTILSSTTVEAATHMTTSALNLRSGPSTNKSKFLVIPKGGQVDSLSVQSNGWHQVKYNNNVGFVSGKYLKQITQSTPPGPSPSPVSNLSSGNVVIVNSSLNMRTGPSKAYKVLLTISNGKEAEYIGTDSTGWYQIRYNGKTGYISHRFSTLRLVEIPTIVPTPVEVAPVQESDPIIVQEPVQVPEPVPAIEPIPAAVEEPAPASDPAPIPAQDPATTTEPTPLPEPAPVQEAAPIVNQLQQVTLYYPTTSLNLRAGAGTNYPALTSIPKGTHLMIEEISGKWHKVTYRNMTGWISGNYLDKALSG